MIDIMMSWVLTIQLVNVLSDKMRIKEILLYVENQWSSQIELFVWLFVARWTRPTPSLEEYFMWKIGHQILIQTQAFNTLAFTFLHE